MMIDKRLIGMMGDSKRYIAKNVALQWLALAANVAMIFAVSRYLGALYDQLTIGDTMAGAPNLPLTLGIVAAALLVRAACTRGGIAAGRRRRRAAGDLLRRVSAAVFLRHAGACHPVCGAGPGQRKGGGHPDDLRAADPGFHRGCAEICQAAAGQILGPVCRPGR